MHVVAVDSLPRVPRFRTSTHSVTSRSISNSSNRRPRFPRRYRLAASSSNQEENGQPNDAVTQNNESSSQIKQTMADLDAILGIEEEKESIAQTSDSPTMDSLTELSPSVEQEIRSLAAEMKKKLDGNLVETGDTKESDIIEKMTSIIKNAKGQADGPAKEKQLLESLESLLQSVSTPEDVSSVDIQLMKDRVFGTDTFWVTDVTASEDLFGGYRFRGNMRGGDPGTSFTKIEARVKEIFGDKYEVLMFEEPPSPDQLTDSASQRKVYFQVSPAETARPPASPSWRPVAVGVLFLFTVATSYILGVSSNAGSIPPAVATYLSVPENLSAAEWPDYVQKWDAATFLTTSATVAVGVMALQLFHELGHLVMAFLKKIKLKGSLLLPSTQIGTMGSSTQLDSLVKTKQDLWDLAFGGLAAGGGASIVLFLTGLFLIQGGSIPTEALIPVPTVLFQGSTLIGGFLQWVLGDVESQKVVFLHPFTVAGWCGMTATALNALPVGNLDGGKMMLATFGRNTLNISSALSYAGLGVGLLGSSLAFPFGLFVLLVQRDPEIYIQNQVTPTERTRMWITVGSVAVALLILLPMGLFDSGDSMMSSGGPLI